MTATPRKPVPDPGAAETIGELSRMLAAFKADTHDDLIALNSRLDQLNFVTPQVYAADRHADTERHKADIARMERIEADLRGIQSNNQWLWRTIVGAIVIALVGVVVALSGVPH